MTIAFGRLRRLSPTVGLLATLVSTLGSSAVFEPDVSHAASTIYVSTSGNDNNSGTSGSPKRTIAAAVKTAVSGDTILLRGGTYSESVQVYGESLTIASAPGERAVLDGTKSVTGWTYSDGDWVANWSYRFAQTSGDTVDPNVPQAGLPDQLFIDGSPLAQVTSRSAVTTGKFYYDKTAGRMWIGTNPTDRFVRASYLPWAFYLNKASGSTLRDITIRRFATPAANMAAVRAYSDNVILSGLLVEQNAYMGISVMGNNVSVNSSVVQDNGFVGIHGHRASNVTVKNNGVHRNNRELFATWHSASGTKFTESSHLQFRDNHVSSNIGPGMWFDISASHVTVTGNLVDSNRRAGIMLELSGQAVIADNVAINNGTAGLWILESNDVSLWNNAAFGNLRDVWVEDGPRTSPTSTTTVRWDVLNVTVRNNIVGGGREGAQALMNVDDWTEKRSATDMKVTSNHNAFWLPGASPTKALTRWARWSDTLAISSTLSGHRSSTGQDGSSISSNSSSNPYTRSASGYDYRMPTGVAANGSPLSSSVASALAMASGSPVRIGPVTAAHVVRVPNQSSSSTVPETTVPETTVPETTVPETTVPETTVPETTVPETTVADPETDDFVNVEEVRMLDSNPAGQTVDGTYVGVGPWAGQSIFTLQVAGRGPVPDTAKAVLVTVGATSGAVTAYACGTQPSVPTLEVPQDENIGMASLVIDVSSAGTICLATTEETHFTVDVTGYLTAAGSPLDRQRLLDTRDGGRTADGTYGGTGTLPAGFVLTMPVAGRGGVPTDSRFGWLALRVPDATAAGSIFVYPCDQERPDAPSLEITPAGRPWTTLVARFDAQGSVCIVGTMTFDLTVDAIGHIS